MLAQRLNRNVQLYCRVDLHTMLVLPPYSSNSTKVVGHSTKVLAPGLDFAWIQAMLFSGRDWLTANSANSNRVDTPSLSKMLLR